MGSPVLANICMGVNDSKELNENNINKSKLYLRYVDDILATFKMDQDSFSF